MNFEDVLKEVGGYGPYQKYLIVVFLIPSSIVIPWFSYSPIFVVSTPDHWCHVPEVASSNLSVGLQRHLISPRRNHHCTMHDVDYSSILRSEHYLVDDFAPTKKCDQGWQFDKKKYDATAVTEWLMVCKDDFYSSMVLSLSFLGMAIGTPLFGIMSDRIGRKRTFLISAVIIGITDIGGTFSPFFALYLVLRALNGLCLMAIYSVSFVLLLEMVSPEMRGRISGLSTTAWVIGMCLLPLIAWLSRNWIYLSLITTAAAGSLVLYWRIIPESPSWLISQERYQEAHDILSKISKSNSKSVHETTELMDLIQVVGEHLKCQKENEEKSGFLDFFKYPKLRMRFFSIVICWISASVAYNGHQLNAKNLAGSEFLNFFYLSAVEMPASLLAWAAMEKVGRRWCTCGSFLFSVFACMVPLIPQSKDRIVTVSAALLAKAAVSAAYMTVFVMAPELFPTALRSVGMGACTTLGITSTLVAPYIVYMDKYGSYIPFLCFAVVSVFGVVGAAFLPETMDQELPQTISDVESFVSKRPFFSCSRTVVPNEEQTAAQAPPPPPGSEQVRVEYIQKEKGSADSIQSVFFVPLPNYTNMNLISGDREGCVGAIML